MTFSCQTLRPSDLFLLAVVIPCWDHVGLTPQAVNALGGYGARGKSEAEAEKIGRDARAVDAAGCFLLVIEGVMEEIADKITEAVSCPTIGIGASARCDGQVLVAEDMLGMFERVPRFVKRYERSEEHTSELQSLMRISYAVFCLQKIKSEENT